MLPAGLTVLPRSPNDSFMMESPSSPSSSSDMCASARSVFPHPLTMCPI